MLLEEQFELFNHEFVDWATFDKVRNETLNSITFIDDDTLDTKVGNVDIDVQFGFSLFAVCGLLLPILFTRVGDSQGLRAIDRRGSGMACATRNVLCLLHDFV